MLGVLQAKLKKMKNKKGFTLMEMLIVVAIIAILLAILIPAFAGALNDAKVRADQANVRSWYAQIMAEEMTKTGDATFSKPEYPEADKKKLQAKGAKVETAGTTITEFTVTYTNELGAEHTMVLSGKKTTTT